MVFFFFFSSSSKIFRSHRAWNKTNNNATYINLYRHDYNDEELRMPTMGSSEERGGLFVTLGVQGVLFTMEGASVVRGGIFR